MVVFPGGVDVHTHIGGAAPNFARGLIPEQHRKARPIFHAPGLPRRPCGHHPNHLCHRLRLRGHGLDHRQRGRGALLSAKHTHEELRDTPIIDRTCCVLMANNEIVLDLLENEEYDRAKQVVAWYIWAAKAYGIKAVNPGGVAGVEVGEGLQGASRTWCLVTRRRHPRR